RRRDRHTVAERPRRKLCQAEIEQLGSRSRQHDIARLQIAVYHALPVRLVQGIRYLDGVPQCVRRRYGPSRQSLRERFPLQVLDDEEIDRPLISGRVSDVEHGTDVWVAQRGERLRFTLESLFQIW